MNRRDLLKSFMAASLIGSTPTTQAKQETEVSPAATRTHQPVITAQELVDTVAREAAEVIDEALFPLVDDWLTRTIQTLRLPSPLEGLAVCYSAVPSHCVTARAVLSYDPARLVNVVTIDCLCNGILPNAQKEIHWLK